MAILDKIVCHDDLVQLKDSEQLQLCEEIRNFLVSHISRTGGHLASNLGVVELTLALHRVFNTPEDKLVFDVGHQSYVHKMLTGRYARFNTLRAFGGLSGFPKRSESDYDVFETGHASTAISAALGLARARDYRGEAHRVVAVVGDGALGNGVSLEALNNIRELKRNLILVINDNKMSISKSVGTISTHLTRIITGRGYNHFKSYVK